MLFGLVVYFRERSIDVVEIVAHLEGGSDRRLFSNCIILGTDRVQSQFIRREGVFRLTSSISINSQKRRFRIYNLISMKREFFLNI